MYIFIAPSLSLVRAVKHNSDSATPDKEAICELWPVSFQSPFSSWETFVSCVVAVFVTCCLCVFCVGVFCLCVFCLCLYCLRGSVCTRSFFTLRNVYVT